METFSEQIEREVEKLSREQRIEFAWRCGMRALPFLGAGGNFSFWKDEERQKHLLDVFFALDCSIKIAGSGLNIQYLR